MDLLCNDDDDDDDGGVAVAMQQGITGERSRHMANKKPGIIESKSMNKKFNSVVLLFYHYSNYILKSYNFLMNCELEILQGNGCKNKRQSLEVL